MTTATDMAALFSVLSLVALGATVGAIMLAFRPNPKIKPLALIGLAFAIAATATAGSLYFSGIANFVPCRLCWWQRIFMYPLVPVLGVALVRRDRFGFWYGLPLSIIGAGWSIYHVWLQRLTTTEQSCGVNGGCADIWVNTWGIFSIPVMALAGFVSITALLAAAARS